VQRSRIRASFVVAPSNQALFIELNIIAFTSSQGSMPGNSDIRLKGILDARPPYLQRQAAI
jgi:hypothetical protein